MVQSHIFDQLSTQDQQTLQRIFDGIELPPLYSDTIAKRVFSADIHPDRLNFLLQNIAKDATIDVRSSAAAEDEALSGILSEIHNMSQDKEVQIMLTQEMFDRMDRESYGDEREEKGMEKGMEKGESKFADLTGKLLSAGRIEDVKKASADPIYRKKLYEELQIQ